MDTLWIETVSSLDLKISFQEELDVYSDNELDNHSAIMPVVPSGLCLRTVEALLFKMGRSVVKCSESELDMWCELSLGGVNQSVTELRPRDWGHDLFSCPDKTEDEGYRFRDSLHADLTDLYC